MSFFNRVRVPLQVYRPQFPEKKTVFTKADGTIKTLSVQVQKKYDGETDYLPEQWHEKIAIALAHDIVNIEGDKYLGQVSKDGDYQITWPTAPPDYPLAKAAFAVFCTPFDGANSNCMTCEQALQLNLVDDMFNGNEPMPTPLDENTDYTLQVLTNDEICCYPFVVSLTSFNTAYLTSASIDANGLLHIHTGIDLPPVANANLATYRVTCSSGAYDEADVFANINGTAVDTCLPPTNVTIDTITTTTAVIHWTPSASTPNHYYIQIYLATGGPMITDFYTNNVDHINLFGLTAGTNYKAYVRAQCAGPITNQDDATASTWVIVPFSTAPESAAGLCGSYSFIYSNPGAPPASMGGHINVTYTDCNGALQTVYVPNGIANSRCVMQTSPGNPTNINSGGNPFFHYTYEHEC